MKKFTLVTGGGGYIGSHVCKALSAMGYIPVTLDNLVYGHRWAIKWGPFIEGDLADKALLKKIFADYNIEAVMHFAAYAYVGESMQDPGKYFRNNVSNAVNLLDAMVEAGVNKIVFSSTCATYGNPIKVPIDENHPQKPINPYGESKLFIERALHWYGQAHGMKAYVLRYFNAAGADSEAEIGEAHDPETHLIPLVIETALGLRSEVKLFGTDYDTADGTALRDYIHVTDLAAAHVQAVTRLIEGSGSRSINLGTGRGYSVREVIMAVERISGKPVNIIESPRREGDPAALVAAPELAFEVLNWKPSYSDLDTIIKTALQWHAKQVKVATACH